MLPRDLVELWSRRSRTGKAALAALALGVGVGAAYPFAVSLARVASALHHAAASPLEVRRRIFGAPYADGVEAVRRKLPVDSPYALVETGETLEGGSFCLRFDLAPRKAVDLGRMESLPPASRLEAELPREIRWAVVSRGRWAAPLLLTRAELLARSGQGGPSGRVRRVP